MAITDGLVVAVADLNAQVTGAQALLQADNAQLPVGFDVSFQFESIVAGGLNAVPPRRLKKIFVVPFDCYLDALAVMGGDVTNPSNVTVALTGDGALPNWPTTITGAFGASPALMPRLLYDNTKTKIGADFATASRAFRVYPRGATCTLQVTAASATTASLVQVLLAFRQYFARE